MNLPEILVYVRHELEITQAQLARKLGLSQSAIGHAEVGRTSLSVPNLNKLAKLCKKHRIKIDLGEIFLCN